MELMEAMIPLKVRWSAMPLITRIPILIPNTGKRARTSEPVFIEAPACTRQPKATIAVICLRIRYGRQRHVNLADYKRQRGLLLQARC
jgi:hypothetical protein